jgi:hypothetical protein
MAVHGFDSREVVEVLDTLVARSVQVGLYYDWRPQLRDPDDELVLAVAIHGDAPPRVRRQLKIAW